MDSPSARLEERGERSKGMNDGPVKSRMQFDVFVVPHSVSLISRLIELQSDVYLSLINEIRIFMLHRRCDLVGSLSTQDGNGSEKGSFRIPAMGNLPRKPGRSRGTTQRIENDSPSTESKDSGLQWAYSCSYLRDCKAVSYLEMRSPSWQN